MTTTRQIIQAMPGRYLPGKAARSTTFYFSIGDEKWTLTLSPDRCEVAEGKTIDQADCVLKCTPELFEKMVLHGKMPGPLDIARGKIKTNDPAGLKAIKERFRI